MNRLDVRVVRRAGSKGVPGFRHRDARAQNIEIRVRNRGDRPLVLTGFFLLENRQESLRCSNLVPPREHAVAPGQTVALSCSLSHGLWEKYEKLTLFDTGGCAYPVSLPNIRG